jgi:hypothetical protein
MVLCLIGLARPSGFSSNGQSNGRLASSFATSGPSSNAHVNHGSHARNDTIDLSAIEPRKQMARRIPAPNQDEFDIGTLDIYGLEPFPKP